MTTRSSLQAFVAVLVALTVAAAVFAFASAHSRLADAPEPPTAPGLADTVREQLWSSLDVPIPPFRTAILEYEEHRGNSFVVRVAIHSLAFGVGSRPALALAPCYSAGDTVAGGWIDVPGNEEDLRADFLSAVERC